jgi:hypothetical protein
MKNNIRANDNLTSFEEMPPDTRVSARVLCKRYQCCNRTLDRWLKDEATQMPMPRIVRRRHYWTVKQILEWEAKWKLLAPNS